MIVKLGCTQTSLPSHTHVRLQLPSERLLGDTSSLQMRRFDHG